MSMTYVDMYENERRAIEISIRDQDDATWDPTAAYASVIDEDGDTVVAEAVAYVTDNLIYTIIDSTVTETPGNYQVIWRITKTSGVQTYTYYHKTVLTVKEL